MSDDTDERYTNGSINPVVRHHAAKNNRCPECNGELDTGYECTHCGYDAVEDLNYRPVATRDLDIKARKP